jgi:hypothetical protein
LTWEERSGFAATFLKRIQNSDGWFVLRANADEVVKHMGQSNCRLRFSRKTASEFAIGILADFASQHQRLIPEPVDISLGTTFTQSLPVLRVRELIDFESPGQPLRLRLWSICGMREACAKPLHCRGARGMASQGAYRQSERTRGPEQAYFC